MKSLRGLYRQAASGVRASGARQSSRHDDSEGAGQEHDVTHSAGRVPRLKAFAR